MKSENKTDQARHTPGPWKVVGTEIWGPHVRLVNGRGAYDEKDRAKNNANARLIASCPDLLDACKFFINSLEASRKGDLTPQWDFSDWATVEFVVKKAIAKAEGQNAAEMGQ